MSGLRCTCYLGKVHLRYWEIIVDTTHGAGRELSVMPKHANHVEVMMPRSKSHQEELLENVAAEMGKDPDITAAIRKARKNIRDGKTIAHEEVMRGHLRGRRRERKSAAS